MKQFGFTLLEILLVLVCMAAITSWTMHHYQQKQRRAQTLQVESDVKSLQRALDSYFHTVGCKPAEGEFAADLSVDCSSKLQTAYPVICSRLPLVTNYQTKIIDTGKTTQDPVTPKRIYQLEVQAVMSSALTTDQIKWYQQELGAKSTGDSSSTLYWNSLPSNSYVQAGDSTWILNGAASVFRASENARTPNAANVESSGSLCAN